MIYIINCTDANMFILTTSHNTIRSVMHQLKVNNANLNSLNNKMLNSMEEFRELFDIEYNLNRMSKHVTFLPKHGKMRINYSPDCIIALALVNGRYVTFAVNVIDYKSYGIDDLDGKDTYIYLKCETELCIGSFSETIIEKYYGKKIEHKRHKIYPPGDSESARFFHITINNYNLLEYDTHTNSEAAYAKGYSRGMADNKNKQFFKAFGIALVLIIIIAFVILICYGCLYKDRVYIKT